MANPEDRVTQILAPFKEDQKAMNSSKWTKIKEEKLDPDQVDPLIKKALYYEHKAKTEDVIKLKYLADAGIPEAQLAWAKFCYYGKYTHYDRVKAYALVHSFLIKICSDDYPPEKRKALLDEYLSPDDPFIAEVIAYRHGNQYGMAFLRKLWVYANQVRLTFVRTAAVINNAELNAARAHPGLGCTAFLFFLIRLGKELGHLFHSYHRDWEKRKYRGEQLKSVHKANWEYVKRYLTKGERPLRFWNDIMWAGIGIFGFTVELLVFLKVITAALGTYTLLNLTAPVIASTSLLVAGFIVDVAIEIVRTYQEVKALKKEISTLNSIIADNNQILNSSREALTKLNSKLRREEQSYASSRETELASRENITALKGHIEALEGKIKNLIQQNQSMTARVAKLEEKMDKDILKHTINIAATSIIAIGMVLARILPMVCHIDPKIGAVLVLVMAGLWLAYRVGVSIQEYRSEQLPSKLENSFHNVKKLYNGNVPGGQKLAKLEAEIQEKEEAKTKAKFSITIHSFFKRARKDGYVELSASPSRPQLNTQNELQPPAGSVVYAR